MATFINFLRPLLSTGSARLADPPRLRPGEREVAVSLLRDAYHDLMLDVAGAAPPFRPALALQTAEWAGWVCWHLLHRGETTAADIEVSLPLLTPGPDAADHASADVVLRLLAGAYRRARATAPTDVLSVRIEQMLRRWPLSGVLADIDEAPLTPLDFGGHPGLLLLYAERFATRPRPQWRPEGGPASEYIELTLAERNRS